MKIRTLITATGKEVPVCIAAIYLREAHAKTVEFLPKQRQINRMIGFNRSMMLGFCRGGGRGFVRNISEAQYNSI